LLMVTHDAALGARAHRRVMMEDGHKVSDGVSA
jgi:predicted ABC-type transport system involved in lysophospholipase L1 biosynthesis ATPase subunit